LACSTLGGLSETTDQQPFCEEKTMAEVNKWMIDPNDAVILLIDHQSGLFQLVKDIDLPVLRSNVTALAKVARLAKIPTITTASVPDGPNGPLIPEIHECNPEAVYVPRTGQINAWDNPAWVAAIEQTQRKTLLIAGTLTSVCMAFPALSAVEAGYKVFCIVDASGNWSKMATDLTIARIVQAGAMPIDTFAVITELQSTWNRPDAMAFAAIFADHVIPGYRALMESYDKAQDVQKVGRETKLDRLEAATAQK
jgi:nicotinamidase-related amidase